MLLQRRTIGGGVPPSLGTRFVLLLLSVLALALMPTIANAVPAASWEHEDDSHNGWTAVSAEMLASGDPYVLNDGKYYFSGAYDEGWGRDVIDSSSRLVVEGDVVLCLADTRYSYGGTGEGSCGIEVKEGASLTICCCGHDEYYNYDGEIVFSNVGNGIDNHGSFTMAGGGILANTVAEGACAYNHAGATMHASGGGLSGASGNLNARNASYGIYNASGGKLEISGTARISGEQPGDGPVWELTPTGPLIDVMTSDTITVSDLPTEEELLADNNAFRSYSIGWEGAAGAVVVSGVSGDADSTTGLETWMRFSLTYPENAELIYQEPQGANPGTLTYAGNTSLTYLGSNVMDGTYYKIENGELAEAAQDDYTVLWDEDEKTLTLNGLDAEISPWNDEAVFDADCESYIVETIGSCSIKLSVPSYSPPEAIFRNTGGDIVLRGANESRSTGGLSVSVGMRQSESMSGDLSVISADGDVSVGCQLSVTCEDGAGMGDLYGVTCTNLINQGAYSFSTNGVKTCCAIDAAASVANEENALIDIDMLDCSAAVGIQSRTFGNSGTIEIKIESDAGAVGIGCYESDGTTGSVTSAAGDWSNAGSIEIEVSGDGSAVAALGGSSLAGIDWRPNGGFSFDNSGNLAVTATAADPSQLSQDNWPSWQYFDTVGVGLMPRGDSSFDNSGTMTISALNGYTAGLYIGGSGDYSISMENSGDLGVTTTTAGGDNIRSVGIFAQIPAITDGGARELPLSLNDGSLTLSVSATDGVSNLEEDALWGICLVQTFTGSSAPTTDDEFQQIDADGMSLSGEPVVIRVENDGKNNVAFINTIGEVDEEGSVVPSTEVSAIPTLTGTVSITGDLVVGSTLTAEVSETPDDAEIVYQWQRESADGTFVNIAGANGPTYVLSWDDTGAHIRVVITSQGEGYGGQLVATTEGTVSRPYVPPSRPTYRPEVEETDNGTVAVTPSYPHKGDTVTVTPEPDEGFVVGTVEVTDKDGEPVEVTDNGDGTYTFVQPAGRVTIAVTFACDGGALCPSAGLADVDQTEWYHGAVDWAVSTGALVGYDDGTFGPDEALTRAQMATVLWRLAGRPAGDAGLPGDCAASELYAAAVSWALSEGVFNGHSDGTFEPDGPISREQVACVLYNRAEAGGEDVSARTDLSGLADAGELSGWAREAMSWAVAEGVFRGVELPDGSRELQPGRALTRAEAAALLMRLSAE